MRSMRRLTTDLKTSFTRSQQLPTAFDSFYTVNFSSRTAPTSWVHVNVQRARQVALLLILGTAVWVFGLLTHKCTHPFHIDERSRGVDYVGARKLFRDEPYLMTQKQSLRSLIYELLCLRCVTCYSAKLHNCA